MTIRRLATALATTLTLAAPAFAQTIEPISPPTAPQPPGAVQAPNAVHAPEALQAQTSQAPRTPQAPKTPQVPKAPPAPPAPPAAPGEPAPPPPPPAPPRRVGQPVNIRMDVTITDSGHAGTPIKKTVSIVTADGAIGRIRSVAVYTSPMPLNIDVDPEILDSGKIRARVNIQYDLPVGAAPAEMSNAGKLLQTSIQENLSVILESGKPIIAAQSADPVGDRQVTIEVKATVLK